MKPVQPDSPADGLVVNTNRMNLRSGRLLLIAAAVLWSTSAAILKSPPLSDIPLAMRGVLLACYRAGFAALFLLPFVPWRQIRFRRALLPMSIAFGVMNALYITALTRTTAAAAIFLQYTSSFWAFVLGVLILKEPIDRRNAVTLSFAVCGIVWIVAGDWNGPHLAGNLLALGAGFSYAVVILTLRILREENAAWLIALNHIVSFALLLPVVWRGESSAVSLGALQWGLVAMMGIVAMAWPYVLFARGIASVPTQEAGLLLLLEPVLNPLWVWLLWGETNTPAVWVGGGLIVLGLALRYMPGFLFSSR